MHFSSHSHGIFFGNRCNQCNPMNFFCVSHTHTQRCSFDTPCTWSWCTAAPERTGGLAVWHLGHSFAVDFFWIPAVGGHDFFLPIKKRGSRFSVSKHPKKKSRESRLKKLRRKTPLPGEDSVTFIPEKVSIERFWEATNWLVGSTNQPIWKICASSSTLRIIETQVIRGDNSKNIWVATT